MEQSSPWEELLERLAQRLATFLLPALTRELRAALRARSEEESSALLDVRATAKHLGVAAGTIYKMAARGDLPSVKVGGRLMFRRVDLDDYVSKQLYRADKIGALAERAKRK